MEHAHDLVRPWRRATIAVSAIAAVELIVLAGIAIALLGNPLTSHLRETAAVAGTPRERAKLPAAPKHAVLERGETSILVLNGNGESGAAAAAAARVTQHGYLVANVGNAP